MFEAYERLLQNEELAAGRACLLRIALEPRDSVQVPSRLQVPEAAVYFWCHSDKVLATCRLVLVTWEAWNCAAEC